MEEMSCTIKYPNDISLIYPVSTNVKTDKSVLIWYIIYHVTNISWIDMYMSI